MFSAAAVRHELWPEQFDDDHHDLAERDNDDAQDHVDAVWNNDADHYQLAVWQQDHYATSSSPASHRCEQHDDAPHAHDDDDALEPFIVEQRWFHHYAAAAVGFTRRRPAGR